MSSQSLRLTSPLCTYMLLLPRTRCAESVRAVCQHSHAGTTGARAKTGRAILASQCMHKRAGALQCAYPGFVLGYPQGPERHQRTSGIPRTKAARYQCLMGASLSGTPNRQTTRRPSAGQSCILEGLRATKTGRTTNNARLPKIARVK